MSRIEQVILTEIQYQGPLMLKELRDAVNTALNLTTEPLPLDTIKTIAMHLVEDGQLDLKSIGNGYLFKLRGNA